MVQLHPFVLNVYKFLQLTIYKEGSETTTFYATHLSREADDCTLEKAFPMLLLLWDMSKHQSGYMTENKEVTELTVREFGNNWLG